jgi:hypothetical protein
VTTSAHRLGSLLVLVITPVKFPYVISIQTRDLGISDHYMVITSLSCTVHRPTCISSLRRNFRLFDDGLFRSKLSASNVFTKPKMKTDDFACQLRDDVIAILEIAPVKKFTRRAEACFALFFSEILREFDVLQLRNLEMKISRLTMASSGHFI